jgi:hypothetical protein
MIQLAVRHRYKNNKHMEAIGFYSFMTYVPITNTFQAMLILCILIITKCSLFVNTVLFLSKLLLYTNSKKYKFNYSIINYSHLFADHIGI